MTLTPNTVNEALDSMIEEELDEIQTETEENPNRVMELNEQAHMLAEQFIAQCGFDLADSDQRGDEMGSTVKSALVFAFLRLGVDEVQAGML